MSRFAQHIPLKLLSLRYVIASLWLVWLLTPSSALAVEAGTTRAWVFVETSDCEPEALLRRRVERRLEQTRGQFRYWLSVWSTPDGARVKARVIAAEGETFTWKREISGETCAEVSDAAAVIVAVHHAQSLGVFEQSPEATTPVPEEDKRFTKPSETEPPRRSASALVTTKLVVVTSTALAARPGLGALLGLDWQPTLGSTELGRVGFGAGYWFPMPSSTSGEGVQLGGWTAEVAWQPLAWPLSSTLELLAGANFSLTRVQAEGVGFTRIQQATAWRSALGPRLSLLAHFGRLEVSVWVGAEYNLVPQRFFVEAEAQLQQIHELPRFAPTLALSLSYAQ